MFAICFAFCLTRFIGFKMEYNPEDKNVAKKLKNKK